MALDKYKKFLKSKEESLQKDVGGNGYVKKEYTPFFNPNKNLKANKNQNFIVRVLPNVDDGMFFFQYKKHQFKVGSTWKNSICVLSRNSKGKTLSNTCPFCEFLEENSKVIDREAVYALKAKDSYVILIYNPMDDELQRYEVNDYGITDILNAMQKIDNPDFNPDEEGFDLEFTKDKTTPYARIEAVYEPEESIQSLMKQSKKFKELISLENEALPELNDFILKSIKNSFNFALTAFAPTFAEDKPEEIKNKRSKKIVEEEEIQYEGDDEEEVLSQFDPNEEEDEKFFKGIKKDKKSSKLIVEEADETDENENDSDDDDKVENIRSFLKNRKK